MLKTMSNEALRVFRHMEVVASGWAGFWPKYSDVPNLSKAATRRGLRELMDARLVYHDRGQYGICCDAHLVERIHDDERLLAQISHYTERAAMHRESMLQAETQLAAAKRVLAELRAARKTA